MSPEEIKQAVTTLRQQGKSYAQIAKELMLPAGTLYYVAKPSVHKAYRNKRRDDIEAGIKYRLQMQKCMALSKGYTPPCFGVAAALAAFKGACEICKDEGTWQTLVIDHCHTSGKFRRSLCQKCNRLLGMANDNPEILMEALVYLEIHSTLQT